jgi:hypothetical protein
MVALQAGCPVRMMMNNLQKLLKPQYQNKMQYMKRMMKIKFYFVIFIFIKKNPDETVKDD